MLRFYLSSVVVLVLDKTIQVRHLHARRVAPLLTRSSDLANVISHPPFGLPAQPILNESEVHSLFSHPLISFLRSDPPFPSEPDTFEHQYHTHVDIKWTGFPSKVRMHRFLTGREAGGTKPIFGLTA